MKRETAEIFVASLEEMFERLGTNLDKALGEVSRAQWILPKKMTEFLKYGNDRASVIRYFTKHVREPSAAESAKLPNLSFLISRMLRNSVEETLRELPRTRDYRSKISTADREKVCQQVMRLTTSKTFPRAIEQVAAQYGVHPRTIRRIWAKRTGARK
jgi:hypothetical protein